MKMKKIIKNFTAVLLVALMTLLVIPAEQPAASGTYTVYVKVPESWGTPYIWAWNDSADLFDAWPGVTMTDNGDGWYRYSLTTTYLDLIISNGGGAQTSDIRVNGKDVEITVNNDASYEINYRDSYATEWEDGITVTATVPDNWSNPYIWAWDDTVGDVFSQWPGAAMNSAEGNYVMELPNWVTGVIINANNSAIQTMDIEVTPGQDVWITVNSEEDIKVTYFGFESEEDTSAEEVSSSTASENSETTTASGTPSVTQSDSGNGDADGDKPDIKRLLYIIIPVAVFVVIILIVTFTGNGRGKKHSKYASEYDIDYRDIKIDDKELDVDADINDDDIDL